MYQHPLIASKGKETNEGRPEEEHQDQEGREEER